MQQVFASSQMDRMSPESLQEPEKPVKSREWKSLFSREIVFENYLRDAEVACSNHVAPTFCKSRRNLALDYLPAVGSAAHFIRAKTVITVLRPFEGIRTMPQLLHSPPKYRLHKPSRQAVVTLAGVDHYLGPWRSKASQLEYDRLIGEWLANGRQAPPQAAVELTILELANAYRKLAEVYYVKDGRPTGAIFGIRIAICWLREHYGHTSVTAFGPLALKSLQMRMVEAGQCRRYVNDNIDRIRRVFKWGVGEEFVPANVYHALAAERVNDFETLTIGI